MKTATEHIMVYFPVLEPYLAADDVSVSSDFAELSDTEQVFLHLALFFEDPDQTGFSLESLYRQLDQDWLGFALEAVYTFFRKDTYLLQQTHSMLIKEDNEFLNQTQFARFLNDHGLHYSRGKFSVYLSRGKLPDPDLKVAGTPYWEIATCEAFLKELKN